MTSGKLFSKFGLIVLALATLLLVALLNGFLKGARLDLTEDRLFTVNKGTANLLKNLENEVSLELFFSSKQTADAPQLRDFARRVSELLEEMALKSDGKVTLSTIDPEPFSEDEDRAAELGLQSTPLSPGGPEIYLGLAASNSNGTTEVIQFLQPDREQYLEYDVAKIMYLVGRDKAATIGLLTGLEISGGFDMQTRQPRPSWMATQQLQQLYDVVTIDNGDSAIATDVDVLLLIHPAELAPATEYAIDQYVLRGGNLIVFVDPNAEQAAGPNPMPAAPSPASGTPRSSNLPGLFAKWGLVLQEGKVLGDAQHALQVGSPRGGPIRHLGILGFRPDSFSQDDIITQQLNLLHFGSAGVLQPIAKATTSFNPLVLSSSQSMLLDAAKFDSLFDPATLFDGFAVDGQRHVLAARITGPAVTAFADGAPEFEEGEEEPAPHLSESTTDINVVVVADTDFLSNRLWIQVQNFFGQQLGSPFADNGNFLINTVDNMIGNADLISARGRGQYLRRFEVVDELRLKAEQNYRAKEEVLQQSLADTERKLGELQAKKEGDDGSAVLALSPEQIAEIESFQQQKLSIRKQLREVQHQLGSNIEALGTRMKLINIGLIPLLLTVLALVFAGVRRRRSSVQ